MLTHRHIRKRFGAWFVTKVTDCGSLRSSVAEPKTALVRASSDVVEA